MTPTDYRETIERLGLKQSEAGRFFGVNEVTGRRWAAHDGNGPPEPVAKFLRLMLALEFSPEYVDSVTGSDTVTPLASHDL
jgi:hypothetical protein